MEKNDHPVVNSAKTIFTKHQGDVFIIHRLFVDDMMHAPTSDVFKKEFMDKYTRDFDVTGGGLMETFLGPGYTGRLWSSNRRAGYPYTSTTAFGGSWMSTGEIAPSEARPDPTWAGSYQGRLSNYSWKFRSSIDRS
jgi:hypothetical protein